MIREIVGRVTKGQKEPFVVLQQQTGIEIDKDEGAGIVLEGLSDMQLGIIHDEDVPRIDGKAFAAEMKDSAAGQAPADFQAGVVMQGLQNRFGSPLKGIDRYVMLVSDVQPQEIASFR